MRELGGCWRRLRAIRLRYKSEPCWKDRERSGRNIPGCQVVKEEIQRGLHRFLEGQSHMVLVDSYLPQQVCLTIPDGLESSLEMACGKYKPCAHSVLNFRIQHLRPLIKLCSLWFNITLG